MKVQEFIDALNKNGLLISVIGNTESNVSDLSYDSRLVRDDTLFICKGSSFKREYLIDAIKYGASVYVSEIDYNIEGCTALIVNNVRKSMPVLTTVFYEGIESQLKIIGITGTKGKSTTTFFTKKIIDEYISSLDKKSAICSGIYNYDGVIEEESHLTTPENIELFKHISNTVYSGIPYMVMEVSSQALKYDRVSNLNFEVACFNNISRDHISPVEHPTFEDYLYSKLSIFKQCKNACVNLDSDYSDQAIQAASQASRVITYSQQYDTADVYGDNVVSNNGNITFDVHIDGDVLNIHLATFGTINVENALAAIAITYVLGIPKEYIIKGLSLALAPGRMELITSDDGKKMALVDYAHNKLSFEKLFSTLKDEFPDRELIVVCGCVGGRAYERRRDVPEIVSKYAQLFIITEVDYGNEDPCDVCEEMGMYAKRFGANYEIIINREMAIKRALKLANEHTIIIAAGKGNENTIKRGDYNVSITPDAEVIRKYIN